MSDDKKPNRKAQAAALAVACLALWEGCDRVAKHFSVDPPGVITACYGMTNFDRHLNVGDSFTPEQCKQYLLNDIPRYAEAMEKCVKADMPPHRRAALISFTYNVGSGNLCHSSVARHLNAGNVQAGCDALMLYVKANGKTLRGLVRRRQFEREWCLRDD
jgi:lysozyme